METRKSKARILIVGLGGIGSIIVRLLTDIYSKVVRRSSITIMDPDSVEEKNIMYQDFSMSDTGKVKASVIGKRYGIKKAISRPLLSDREISGKFDIVVLAVDNTRTRHVISNMISKGNHDICVIDARAEGNTVGVWKIHSTDKASVNEWTSKIGPDDTTSYSCQIFERLEKGKVDGGNAVSASIAVNYIIEAIQDNNLSSKHKILKLV